MEVEYGKKLEILHSKISRPHRQTSLGPSVSTMTRGHARQPEVAPRSLALKNVRNKSHRRFFNIITTAKEAPHGEKSGSSISGLEKRS